MTAAVVLVVVLLVLTNLANHRWMRRAYMLTCPLVGLLMLAIGHLSGLTWTEMGLGRGAVLQGVLWAAGSVLVIAAGYAVALALPGLGSVVGEVPNPRETFFNAFVEVPFATVFLEEVAFRGVLWGLLAHDHGPAAATLVSSAFFGLWHVLPALGADGVQPPPRLASHPLASFVWVAGTVLFTAMAGVIFCELRVFSGSVLAPMGLHWATNGLGSLVRLVAR